MSVHKKKNEIGKKKKKTFRIRNHDGNVAIMTINIKTFSYGKEERLSDSGFFGFFYPTTRHLLYQTKGLRLNIRKWAGSTRQEVFTILQPNEIG